MRATELQSESSSVLPGAALFSFASKPQRPEALAVLIERLLRGVMLAHGLLGVGASCGVAGLAFFGGEDFRRTG